MPGPKRKPTRLLILNGSAKAHPSRMRARANEPALADDLRDLQPPFHLSPALRAIWTDLQSCLHAGVAGSPDALAFEALVRLVAKMRTGTANAAMFARLGSLLGEFSLTPASRSRVAALATPERPTGFAALKDA